MSPSKNLSTLNGHLAVGSVVEVDGTVFGLTQFHFHAPSENKINGMAYARRALISDEAAINFLLRAFGGV